MAVNAIMEGVRPRKPQGAKQLGFSDELWRVVELCWLEDRDARPGVESILSNLNDAETFWYMRDVFGESNIMHIDDPVPTRRSPYRHLLPYLYVKYIVGPHTFVEYHQT